MSFLYAALLSSSLVQAVGSEDISPALMPETLGG
jgi:hypothetical protein